MCLVFVTKSILSFGMAAAMAIEVSRHLEQCPYQLRDEIYIFSSSTLLSFWTSSGILNANKIT